MFKKDKTMDIFLSLHGHTNNASLPLRFGLRITQQHQQFAILENPIFDEIGTKKQRQYEIEDGRKHYIGTICISNENHNGKYYKFPCRIVLAPPSDHNQRPKVITILSQEANKGDLTVTKHLEEMQKRGQINVDDILKIFHPAYIKGNLQSSNDCEEIYNKEIRGTISLNSFADSTVKSALNNPEPIIKAIKSSVIDEVNLEAPLTYKNLSLSNVKFQYVMADAYISNVRVEEDMIKLNCINSKGNFQELHSFKFSPRPHLKQLHEYAFNYLKEREEQRALFAICVTDPCKGYIAESVTAISMQMMRNGLSLIFPKSVTP